MVGFLELRLQRHACAIHLTEEAIPMRQLSLAHPQLNRQLLNPERFFPNALAHGFICDKNAEHLEESRKLKIVLLSG